jgi:hypothetical protein
MSIIVTMLAIVRITIASVYRNRYCVLTNVSAIKIRMYPLR